MASSPQRSRPSQRGTVADDSGGRRPAAAVWGIRKRVPLEKIDDATARELLEKYGRLVRSEVNRYRLPEFCPAIGADDLLAIGHHALLVAWVSFNPDVAEFTTWLVIQVRQSLSDAVRRAYGQTVAERRAVLRTRAWDDWRERGGRGKAPTKPTGAEREAAEAYALRGFVWLDRTAGRGGTGAGDATLRDSLFTFAPAFCEAPTPEARIDDDRQRAWLSRKLANGLLTPRERHVLRGRLDGETLHALGEQLGISRERARQLEAQATKKLIAEAKSDGLV